MERVSSSILLTLRAGPISASELALRLGVNQATVSRHLKVLDAQVLRMGAGRSTRWCLRRPCMANPALFMLPVYRVNELGHALKIAHLYPVFPDGHYVVEYFRAAESENQKVEWSYYESLPWWLIDMRPQGFLGRSFARQLRNNNKLLNADPKAWSEDEVLFVLAEYPQDSIGNLLIGEKAYSEWLQREPSASIGYEEAAIIAEAIARGEHFDSSAQGEQPKFTAVLNNIDCIIKFSGAATQTVPAAEIDSVVKRWSDLLHVEALSSQVMNQAIPGIAAINTSFYAGSRTFMASQRFDRLAYGGRAGLISLSSLDAEFVGKASAPWPTIMTALAANKIVTNEALSHTKIVWAFGQLIANSDMHLGNLSVLNKGGRPFALAPVYDMLPMHYAPSAAGDLPLQSRAIQLCPDVEKLHWEWDFIRI